MNARSRRCSPATTTRSISIVRSMPASPISTSAHHLGLDAEQARVLERYHTRFVRAGAALEQSAQDRLAAINERLASLGTQFGQNVLADEKSFAMVLEEGDLAGLPDFARAAARAAAEERGQPGKYVITLARSSVETFLQFSSRRDLREKAFQAWISARRERRDDRQSCADRRNGGAARRARQAARLCELRRLPARRSDGQDAGGGARAARRGLGQCAREGRGESAMLCRQ